MKKINAKYFYSPICPESFASLDRLKELFRNYDQEIEFCSFNIFNFHDEGSYHWSAGEKDLIDSIHENGENPLLFGKLFI